MIAVCFCFFVNYFLLIMMIAMLVLPIASYIGMRYCRDKLEIVIEVPSQVERGEEITVRVHMKNSGYIPMARVQVSLNMENPFYAQPENYYMCCGVPAFKEALTSLNIRSDYCGCINITANRAEMWDFTGMFSYKIPMDFNASVVIIAQGVEAAFSTEAIGGAGLTELVEQDVKGNDSSTVIDTRDYRPGDKPNRIHWKLSTKLEKLIVKEYGAISSNDVLVLINLYKPNVSHLTAELQHMTNLAFDRIFDAYMTMLAHLMKEKRPFTLCFYAPEIGELKHEDVTTYAEGVAVLSEIYYEALSTEPLLAIDLCKKTMDEFGEFIYICPAYEECENIEGEYEELFDVTQGERVLSHCYWIKH